jgi:uncharacterized membrane protein YphA (DoxX/SURF4 family)
MLLLGKWMIATLFLAASILNCIPPRPRDHIERMAGFGVPLPAFSFWFGIGMEFAGCALLLTGLHPQAGIALLIAFTAIAGGIFHRFWLVEDPIRRQQLRIALLNNIAVIGGLLVLLHEVR